MLRQFLVLFIIWLENILKSFNKWIKVVLKVFPNHFFVKHLLLWKHFMPTSLTRILGNHSYWIVNVFMETLHTSSKRFKNSYVKTIFGAFHYFLKTFFVKHLFLWKRFMSTVLRYFHGNHLYCIINVFMETLHTSLKRFQNNYVKTIFGAFL